MCFPSSETGTPAIRTSPRQTPAFIFRRAGMLRQQSSLTGKGDCCIAPSRMCELPAKSRAELTGEKHISPESVISSTPELVMTAVLSRPEESP
jgi:hypothetical protein